MKKWIYISIAIFWFPFSPIIGQEENCAFKLREAEKLYQQGLIEDIPGLISECLEDGFTKEDKLQAYKLLILTYLFEDEVQNAEQSMFDFIKKYPEYEIVPTDPVDFIYLYKSYRALPIVSVGATVGGSYSFATIREPYGTNNLNATHGKYNQSGMGLQFGFKVNFFIYENIELNTEILYAQNKFEYVDENLFGFNYLSFDETQTRLDIPISFTYDFDIHKKFKPFVRAGLNLGYIFETKALVSRAYNDNSHETVTGPDINLGPQRKPFNYWATIGGGMKYKISRGYLMVDLQYNIGLANQVNPEERYDDPDQLFYYYYTGNDFLLNTFNLRLGYVYTFYKPIKK